jgi:diguanylate cyclase (GGDEF)-like protein
VPTLLERLRPRSPWRDSASAPDAWVAELLLAGDDRAALARLVQARARRMPGCNDAWLHPARDSGPAARRAAGEDAPTLEVPLAEDRFVLALWCESDPAHWPGDEDAGWIDLLDLRLRELLATQELHGAAEASRRGERLQQVLYAIADLAHADLDLHEMLGRVHRIVCGLTYAENFYIALYDDLNDTMRFAYDADVASAPIAREAGDIAGKDFPSSLTFAVLHRKRSLLGPSFELRRQLGLGNDPRLGPDCVDWLGVPMLEGERVRGAVVVQSYDEARHYSEEDRALLTYVAQHILTALQRKHAQEELEAEVARRTAQLADANRDLRAEVHERERAQQLQGALFRIAELAGTRGGLDEFFAGVHGVVSGLLDARNFFIALLSEDGAMLTFPYFIDEWDTPLQTRRLTNGISEWVLRHKRPLLASAAEIRALIDAGEMVMFGTVPECWLGVPLLLGERAVGVMVVQSYEADRSYGAPEQEILQFASFHIATALERKQTQERLRLAYAELEQRVQDRTRELKLANDDLREQIVVREQAESRLKHEALHDALTGLPNRTALLGRLERALTRHQADPSRVFAVLFLDLDRFKVVNDSVGHLLGDELLIEAGRRIAACVRAPDSVARLGGDEFTILLEDIHGVDDACHVANRVLAALRDPIRLREKEIYTSASIGIALAHPRYRRAEELLRDADVAMYRAKAHGRQRYELFDEQLHEQALQMLDLESDLRRALSRREFEPFLQPIVRLSDGSVLGYEALLRWRHATRGLLLPAEFLTVAEESGNVEQIDWQLYEQVFRTIPDLGESQAYVGINVSARHFRAPDLAGALLEMIEAYRVPPWRVRIEVTEGALLQNPDQARATMLRLRDAGVLTSLDDFGTGYSSLSYLHRFPLHALKIDRSFVSDLQPDLAGSSAAVVRAIRALAGSLGMEVIAEGIETPVQREALIQLECAIGQGFLFAAPRPAQDMARRH